MPMRSRTVFHWLCLLGFTTGCGVAADSPPSSLQTQPLVAATGEGGATGGADDAAVICEDRFDDLMGPECTSCLAGSCGVCDEECRSLLTCGAEQCAAEPNGVLCTASECGACAGDSGLTSGLNLALCAANSCEDVCPLLAQAGAVPTAPVPAPEPVPDGCRQDTAAAVGEECIQCAQDLCAAEMSACDGPCQELITCAVDECGGGQDLACITASCGSCLGAATPAQNVGSCLQRNCAEVCPVDPPPADEEPESGDPDEGETGADGTFPELGVPVTIDPEPSDGGGAVAGGGDTGAVGGGSAPTSTVGTAVGDSAGNDEADSDSVTPADDEDRTLQPRRPRRHRGIVHWFRRLLRHIFG